MHNNIGIQIYVLECAEEGRGVFRLTIRISSSDDIEKSEQKTVCVFRYFLRGVPFCGTVPQSGTMLDTDAYDALLFAEVCSLAARKAVSLLSYSDHTAKALDRKLRAKGVRAEASEAAVAYCIEKGYIREKEQLSRLMEQLCSQKLYGMRRIRQAVYEKGFSDDIVKSVFAEYEDSPDFRDALANALETRIRKLGRSAFSAPDRKRRAVASLMRYGFSYSEIAEQIKNLFPHASDDDTDEIAEFDDE